MKIFTILTGNMMTLVYELALSCTTTYDYRRISNRSFGEAEPYISYYNSYLKIYRKTNLYEVWVTVREITLFCEAFKTQRDAEKYVNKVMKPIMRGMFVYKNCYLCQKKVYYPDAFCDTCRVVVYPVFYGWIVEKENEKFSEHMGFSRPIWKQFALCV